MPFVIHTTYVSNITLVIVTFNTHKTMVADILSYEEEREGRRG